MEMTETQKDDITTTEDKNALSLRLGKEASKAARKLRQQRIRQTITLFKSVFPHTFKENPVPLKCEINHDIVTYWQSHEAEMGTLSKKHLRDTLQFYTSRLAYHEACLAENAMRIDLTGTVIEAVSDKAKTYHQDCVNKILAIHKKRTEKRNKKASPSDTKSKAEKKSNTAPETKVQETTVKTDANGRPVLTLKKKS